MSLWGKGTAVRDAKWDFITAVQVITVGERQVVPDAILQETSLGGISSLTFKATGGGMGVTLPRLLVQQPGGKGSILPTNGFS